MAKNIGLSVYSKTMPPKKVPRKKPAKKPKPAPPPPLPKRSMAFRKAALAASALATLAMIRPHLERLAGGRRRGVAPAGIGTAASMYPTTATVLDPDDEDDLSDAFAALSTAGTDESPTDEYRAAQGLPLAGPSAEELALIHRAGAALMEKAKLQKRKKGFRWGKGAGLGLTGTKAGSSHVKALYGNVASSPQYEMVASGLASGLQATRRLKPGHKVSLHDAGKRFLKHVSPRRLMSKITRPQAYAALGSLLAATMMLGGREHFQDAVNRGMRQVPSFKALMASRDEPIGEFELIDYNDIPSRRPLTPPKPKLKPKPRTGPNAARRVLRDHVGPTLTMAEKNALGIASDTASDFTGAGLGSKKKRLPGACRNGTCDHRAHLKLSDALNE